MARLSTGLAQGRNTVRIGAVEHRCVVAVLRRGDRVLLGHRRTDRSWFADVWDFPGGHIEEGETAAEALARELFEEVGVDIDPPTADPDLVRDFPEHSMRLAIWFLDHGGPVENRSPDEHDELRWVSENELTGLDLADPTYPEIIAMALRPTGIQRR